VPALFIAGDRDPVIGAGQTLPQLRQVAPGLRDALQLPGCGHWTQQERPDEVSEAMIGFIRELD
jgi:pimeloyl-ACP methyl ester carboxylesterase